MNNYTIGVQSYLGVVGIIIYFNLSIYLTDVMNKLNNMLYVISTIFLWLNTSSAHKITFILGKL